MKYFLVKERPNVIDPTGCWLIRCQSIHDTFEYIDITYDNFDSIWIKTSDKITDITRQGSHIIKPLTHKEVFEILL